MITFAQMKNLQVAFAIHTEELAVAFFRIFAWDGAICAATVRML